MKTYELRSGEIVFSIATYDMSTVRSLPDAQLAALIDSGLQNWAYRPGARKSNDGKTFTLAMIADQLIEGGTRDGEPTKADVEAAKKIIGPMVLAARKEYVLAEGADEAAAAEVQAKRDASVYVAVSEKIDRNAKAQGYTFREPAEDEQMADYLAEWFRFHRLWVARKAKESVL